MQVGMATIFQNPEDHITDGEVYRNEDGKKGAHTSDMTAK